jgi:hypothetical protein
VNLERFIPVRSGLARVRRGSRHVHGGLHEIEIPRSRRFLVGFQNHNGIVDLVRNRPARRAVIENDAPQPGIIVALKITDGDEEYQNDDHGEGYQAVLVQIRGHLFLPLLRFW